MIMRDFSNGKTFRMSLGSLAGGAVKLDADETVTSGLSIGEGVETTIAGMCMNLRPAWAVLNTGGIANFPVLPAIENLHIFKEHAIPYAQLFSTLSRRCAWRGSLAPVCQSPGARGSGRSG
jgi:hypothetical protein